MLWVPDGSPFDFKNLHDRFIDDCAEIQDDFKAVRFPTVEERSKWWEKFCDKRNRFYRIRNQYYEDRKKEFERKKNLSEKHKDYIVKMIYDASPSIPIFGYNSKQTLIDCGNCLKDAMQELTDRKGKMLGKDKAECFELGKRVRYKIDCCWQDYKNWADEYYGEKRRKHEERQREWERKQEAFKERVRENLRKNYEKLSKAEDALERYLANAEKNREQIDSAYSDDFRDLAEGWLSEAESKIDSIRDQIDRLRDWIREDENKL